MKVAIVTLFPEMFTALTDYGISRRALENNLLEVAFWNPRDFSNNRHKTVDDRPYGGGPGMVLASFRPPFGTPNPGFPKSRNRPLWEIVMLRNGQIDGLRNTVFGSK